jgi:hypothetical protein
MKRPDGLPLGEGDGEAEAVELADELGGEALAIGALEVVGAEILIAGAAAKHPVDGGQDRGGDRDDRLLSAHGGRGDGEGGQAAGFGASGAPGDLDQEGLEPGGALAQAGGAAFASTLVVGGAEPGPGDQMGRRRKPAHVATDLGDDAGGGERADPGDGGQPPGGFLKGIEALMERGIERAEGAVDGVDLVQVDLQQLPLSRPRRAPITCGRDARMRV